MASVVMAASSFAGVRASPRRSLVVSAKASEAETVSVKSEGRRSVVLAVAAAAATSVAKIVLADEPKNGTPEAKKKYAAVCTANPTARVCRQ